jgi:hypothetical protein
MLLQAKQTMPRKCIYRRFTISQHTQTYSNAAAAGAASEQTNKPKKKQ